MNDQRASIFSNVDGAPGNLRSYRGHCQLENDATDSGIASRHSPNIPRSLTYTVLCSRNPVVSNWRSLLLGTRAPSLPFVIRSRCSVVRASKANVLYKSLADPPLGILISSGSFLTGLPALFGQSKIQDY